MLTIVWPALVCAVCISTVLYSRLWLRLPSNSASCALCCAPADPYTKTRTRVIQSLASIGSAKSSTLVWPAIEFTIAGIRVL